MPPCEARYAGRVTRAVAAAGFPLQHFTPDFDLGPPGSEAAQRRLAGAVLVDAAAEAPFYGGNLPQGLVAVRAATPCALTFEAPRDRPPADRIAMHRVAVVAAIAGVGSV